MTVLQCKTVIYKSFEVINKSYCAVKWQGYDALPDKLYEFIQLLFSARFHRTFC